MYTFYHTKNKDDDYNDPYIYTTLLPVKRWSIRLEPKNNNNNIIIIAMLTFRFRPVNYAWFLCFPIFFFPSIFGAHIFIRTLILQSFVGLERKLSKKIVTFSENVYCTTKYRTRHRAHGTSVYWYAQFIPFNFRFILIIWLLNMRNC